MAARMCKIDDCAAHGTHRGMCRRHYDAWKRRNPGFNTYRATERAVLAALPGTVAELSAKAGVSWEAVRRVLDCLHEAEQLHVGEWTPPTRSGQRWLAVYVAGPGEDEKLSRARKREHSLAQRRARETRQAVTAQIKAIPPGAGWAATLLIGR